MKITPPATKTARVMYSANADMFYAVGMEMHDPYVWYQDISGDTHAIMSPLEVDRGRLYAKVKHVQPMAEAVKALAAAGKPATTANQIEWLADKTGRPAVLEVPSDFPAGLADDLRALGFTVSPVKGFFFPQRATKTPDEVKKIRRAQSINEKAFRRAFAILKEAKIRKKDNVLLWKGKVLTSAILRGEMNKVLAEHGSIPMNGGPIVSCGAQTWEVHERGEGPLRAHEFIIIDSFPQSDEFYFGDLTRTVIKGKPSKWQRDLWNAVRDGQALGLSLIKAGVNGADVHKAIEDLFAQRGFTTGTDEKGRNYGFFHGTGHSVGIEVHDKGPGISRGRPTDRNPPAPLKAGLVVTVEPGLYYPGKGGARIEDIVLVTDKGIDNLTKLPKFFVIK